MRYIPAVTIGVFFAVITVLPAAAAIGGFAKAAARMSGDGRLVIVFREVGLRDTQATIVAEADTTATYGCVGRAARGMVQSDQRTTIAQHRYTIAELKTEPQNGGSRSVVGTIAITPPPGSVSCPKGQRSDLLSVSYGRVTISDDNSGAGAPIAGTFTRAWRDVKLEGE